MMYTLIAEQPVIVAAAVALIAAALVYGWMQTGNRRLLMAAVATSLLVPAEFALASYLHTDREQIREAVVHTAQAVANNDFDEAIKVIEPAQRDKIAAAKADLNRFHFDEARVNQFQSIDVFRDSVPLTAEVDITAKVVVSDLRGQFNHFAVPRRIMLKFRKANDGNWYVYDYTHQPVVGGPDGFSPK